MSRYAVVVLSLLLFAACDPTVPARRGDGGEPPTPGDDASVPAPMIPPSIEVDVMRPLEIDPRARFPEHEDGFVSATVADTLLTLVYASAIATPFAAGDLLAGDEFLGRAIAVRELSPERVEIDLETIDLTDLIVNGAFHATLSPGTEPLTVVDEDGVVMSPLELSQTFLTPEIRRVRCRVTSGTGEIYVRPTFETDADMDVQVDIRSRELHYAIFRAAGSIEAGISLETTGRTTYDCQLALLDRMARRRLRLQHTFRVIMPPGVPVSVTLELQPELWITGAGTSQTGTSTSRAIGRIGFNAGAEYDTARGWTAIWEPMASGSTGVEVGERGTYRGSLTAEARLTFMARVYDAFGPGISVRPSVTGDFAVTDDACDWSGAVRGAFDLELRAEVRVPLVHWTLARWSATQRLAEATLASASGTFPWCPPTRDAGGAGCELEPNCASCTMRGCVWCDADARCAPSGSCAGPTSPSSCPTCRASGGSCASDGDCCSGLVCSAGGCRAEALCARRERDACATVGDCCPGLECRSQTAGGGTTCCVGGNFRCTGDADCCGAMRCGAGGRCECRASGESCVTSAECCGASLCSAGVCG